MEMLTNFQFVEKVASQLIQPRPCNYTALDIWKHISNKELYRYQSDKVEIVNQRTIQLHLIQRITQIQNKQENHQASTCILYLHGMSSFCVEGTFLVQELERNFGSLNVSVCLYDMRGHGKDQGKNITFGLEQSKQLYTILCHLKRQRNYEQFVLWGRSMGATTILKMMNDFQEQINANSILIKHVVLDSAFCSFEKVAKEIISKRTGMPMIFSKAIFEYLLSAIEKQHKLNMVIQLTTLSKVNTPAIFLSSQTDSLISSQHTKSIFDSYSGLKHRIETNVEHNDLRPEQVLSQVFLKLKNCLLPEQKPKRRRSLSERKHGLSVTKSKKVQCVLTLPQQEETTISHKNQKNYTVNSPKSILNEHSQNLQLNLAPKYKEKYFFDHKSIKISPKQCKTVKEKQNVPISGRKEITLNGFNNYLHKTQKQNINVHNTQKQNPIVHNTQKQNTSCVNLNTNQKSYKQRKLKLSQQDLMTGFSSDGNQNLFKNITSIHQNIQKNQEQNQLQQENKNRQLYGSCVKYNFGEYQQPKSVFQLRNNSAFPDCQIQKNHQLKDKCEIRDTFGIETSKSVMLGSRRQRQNKNPCFLKKQFEEQILHRKLAIKQHTLLGSHVRPVSFRHLQCSVTKPQSQNIHHLKSKEQSQAKLPCRSVQNERNINETQQIYHGMNKSTGKSIVSELIKAEMMKLNDMKVPNNYNYLAGKLDEKILFDFPANFKKLSTSNAENLHRLSNQSYT